MPAFKPTSDLTIRDYVPSDRPALERMALEVVHDGTVFPFEDLQGVLDYWFTSGARRLVAVEGAELLGSYVMRPNMPDRCAHVANAGYMVAEAARGRGVGQAMGEHSITLARELGYRAMQFNVVVATNGAAVRLWQRLGFQILAELPRTFRHPTQGLVNTLVMFRNLEV